MRESEEEFHEYECGCVKYFYRAGLPVQFSL